MRLPSASLPMRRLFRRTSLIAAIGSLVVGVASVPLFIAPATDDDPRNADAVVMYGGGGHRLDLALQLVREGVADTLVVSNPLRPEYRYPPLGRFCRNPHDDFELVCFDPEPKTTRGESRYVADLAEQNDWDRVVVVTSTDQVTRARMMVKRCWEGDVDMIAVPHEQAIPARVIYEWGALGRALITRRGC